MASFIDKIKHSRWTLLAPVGLVFLGSFTGALVRVLCLFLGVLICIWNFYDTELAKGSPLHSPEQRRWRTGAASIILILAAVRLFWVGNKVENLAAAHKAETPKIQIAGNNQETPPEAKIEPNPPINTPLPRPIEKPASKPKRKTEAKETSVTPTKPLVFAPPPARQSFNLYEGNVGPLPSDPGATYFRNHITSSGSGQNTLNLSGKTNFIANVVQGMNINAEDEALLYKNFFSGTQQGVSPEVWKARLDETYVLLQKRWKDLSPERLKERERRWGEFAVKVQMQTLTQEQMGSELRELLDVSAPKQP